MTPRITHPNLFYGVMAFGLWTIINGLNILLSHPLLPRGSYRYSVGAVFLVLGVAEILGINSKYALMWRLSMIVNMMLCVGVSVTYLIGYIKGTILSFEGANNYLFLGIIQLSAISEPIINNLTMKNDGK